MPFKVRKIRMDCGMQTDCRMQTDNGNGFLKHFESYAEANKLIHFFNYPKRPKMNAYIERFNGVLQSQFVISYSLEMGEAQIFNALLMDYL